MIETGRHTRPKMKIEDRICNRCDTNSIEDEFHYIMKCPQHTQARIKLFDHITTIDKDFKAMGEDDKLCYIMSNTDTLIYLATYIKESGIF